jgi:Tfp pilus assembly protein FimT
VTLLELLLVLVILVIMAGMTWPAMKRPMAHQRLRRSADEVRAKWTQARIKAMSSGQTNVFRYTVGENRYAIDVQDAPEFVQDTQSQDTPGNAFGMRASAQESGAVTEGSERTLQGEQIVFSGGETDFDTRADLVCPVAGNVYDVQTQWADPILFFPDGTTSTATLRLRNQYNDEIELTLRGLTGTVKIGESYVTEEVLP